MTLRGGRAGGVWGAGVVVGLGGEGAGDEEGAWGLQQPAGPAQREGAGPAAAP